MKNPVEYEEATIFKNIVLPTNYYLMDKKTDFTSTAKVSQICEDLTQAMGGEKGVKCGLIQMRNGVDLVGFYYCYTNYISITLGYYGTVIYLIGLINGTPYTRYISSTAPS